MNFWDYCKEVEKYVGIELTVNFMSIVYKQFLNFKSASQCGKAVIKENEELQKAHKAFQKTLSEIS